MHCFIGSAISGRIARHQHHDIASSNEEQIDPSVFIAMIRDRVPHLSFATVHGSITTRYSCQA